MIFAEVLQRRRLAARSQLVRIRALRRTLQIGAERASRANAADRSEEEELPEFFRRHA